MLLAIHYITGLTPQKMITTKSAVVNYICLHASLSHIFRHSNHEHISLMRAWNKLTIVLLLLIVINLRHWSMQRKCLEAGELKVCSQKCISLLTYIDNSLDTLSFLYSMFFSFCQKTWDMRFQMSDMHSASPATGMDSELLQFINHIDVWNDVHIADSNHSSQVTQIW